MSTRSRQLIDAYLTVDATAQKLASAGPDELIAEGAKAPDEDEVSGVSNRLEDLLTATRDALKMLGREHALTVFQDRPCRNVPERNGRA
jgi:hypothetical protein